MSSTHNAGVTDRRTDRHNTTAYTVLCTCVTQQKPL